MKRCIVVFTILVGMLLVSNVAIAGRNFGGYANLTWVLSNHVRFTTLPGGTADLFLRLEQISEIAGCEFGMYWGKDVGDPDFGCFELIDVTAPTGTDCKYLMRGTVVFGMKNIQFGYVAAAFAGSRWVSVCTGGQTARMPFDFSFCDPSDTGWFCLQYCKVTDHFGMIDVMTLINGDPGWSCAYIVGPTATQSATWGSIKALYR
jgi:hypothetical protein